MDFLSECRNHPRPWRWAWPVTSLFLAIMAIAHTAAAQGSAGTAQDVVAITDVHVLPMDSDRVLASHTVVIAGERIRDLGPAGSVSIPADARVIPGEGRYLVPGLAEMHGHIPPLDSDPQYVEDVLFLFVANGVTTVRGMLGSPGQLELAARIASGEVVGPTLYLAGPSFSGGSIDSPEQAEARVRAQATEGWHLVKVHPGLTRDEYDAMARTANELNIRFAGHVPADVGLVHALEMRQETFDHVDGYVEYLDGAESELDPENLQGIVRRTREAGAWIVPTMAVWEVLLGALEADEVEAYEELQYMPPEIRNAWIQSHRSRMTNPDLDREQARRIVNNRQQILGALNDGGVGILLGTDSPQQFSVPGFSVRRELSRMIAAGMSPYDILRSGTFNVGQYFRNEDAFGVIAPGMRADMILLWQNPLTNAEVLASPDAVMVRGRWFDRTEIDHRLAEIAERYRED